MSRETNIVRPLPSDAPAGESVDRGVAALQPANSATPVSLSIFPPAESAEPPSAVGESALADSLLAKAAQNESSLVETTPSATSANSPAPQIAPLLHWADQTAVATIVGVSLLAMIFYCLQQGALRGRLIEIEHAAPQRVTFKVDINTADAVEISQLPELGETLAQRIVASRESFGPFRSADDLLRVKGIGPRKMDQLRPLIAPIENADVAAPQAIVPVASQKPVRRTPAKPKKSTKPDAATSGAQP